MKLTALLLALCLAGCQMLFRNPGEDAQPIISQRLIGTPVGDFFQRHGAPAVREEARDRTLDFKWEGGRTSVASGPRGPEELLCVLHISADRNGRIVAVTIIRDGQGQRRLSRCLELLD